MPVEVELFDDLDAVARDAAGALDRAATPSLFDRLDWYRLTLAHCPPPGRPLVARARDGDARAWLFLAVDGDAAGALASWYTLDYRAVARGVGEAALLAAIATALRRRAIATVSLAPILDPAPLRDAFRAAGWLVRASPAGTNWREPVARRDFDGYWADRPGSLRATVRRKAARAALDINVFKQFDCAAWKEYEQVYAASWKPAEGAPRFLRALAEAEGAAGTLRLGIARRDGRPVAAQFWLVENGVATIHKLAHVAAADPFSPGTLLGAAMFRSSINDDRAEWIDFGSGDDAYKADWMGIRRTLHRIEAFDPARPRGLARWGRSTLGALVRPVASG